MELLDTAAAGFRPPIGNNTGFGYSANDRPGSFSPGYGGGGGGGRAAGRVSSFHVPLRLLPLTRRSALLRRRLWFGAGAYRWCSVVCRACRAI